MEAVSADLGCAGPKILKPQLSNLRSSGCMAHWQKPVLLLHTWGRVNDALLRHHPLHWDGCPQATRGPFSHNSRCRALVVHISSYLPPSSHALWLEDAEEVVHLGSQSSM
jgi:hypothetical protein